jgi:hypothetical protein
MTHPGDPVGLRLHRHVTGELAAASAGLAAHGRGLREGVHRARKAIRRTRAALRLGWSSPGADVALALSELQRLNEALSDLRDTHVVVGVVDRLLAQESKEARRGLRKARKALAKHRLEGERDARLQTVVDDVRKQLAFLGHGIDVLPWSEVDPETIHAQLARTQSRIDRARGKAVPDGKPDHWHRWRRRLRRLSQQRRACRDIGIDVAEDLFAKSLAEQLGVLQDLNMLVAHGAGDLGLPDDARRALKHAAKRARDVQRQRLLSVLAAKTGSEYNLGKK